MSKFNRKIEVIINDSRIIKDLRISFRIEMFPFDAYSVMTVEIYNLFQGSPSDGNNSAIESGSSIKIIAGYENDTSLLFSGVVQETQTIREDLDSITTIFSSDNSVVFDPTVNLTSENSTDIKSLISDIAFSANVDIAELDIDEGNIEGSVTYYSRFSTVMNSLATTYKFSWYLYNMELYAYPNDRPSGNLYRINALTGLLEPPILTQKGINVKMLLEPLIKPRDRYEIESGGIQYSQGNLELNELITVGEGEQTVLSIIHTGDTHSNVWFTELEGYRSVQ